MSHLSLLMNGMQQFADANGVPYLAGTVGMYVPNTLTYKETWLDKDHSALNTDPIDLDAAGRATIWGEGIYRQILKDRHGNTIWDKLTLFSDFSGDADMTTLYDLPLFWQGVPGDAEEFPRFVVPRVLTLPAALTASRFATKVNPSAAMVFTFKKNAVSIGTVSFSTLGVPTVTFVAQVGFVSGDIFSVENQAVADATGSGISMTFVFTA